MIFTKPLFRASEYVSSTVRQHANYFKSHINNLDSFLSAWDSLTMLHLSHQIIDATIPAAHWQEIEHDMYDQDPEFEFILKSLYQYHCNSQVTFTNMEDMFIAELPIIFWHKT